MYIAGNTNSCKDLNFGGQDLILARVLNGSGFVVVQTIYHSFHIKIIYFNYCVFK